VAVGADRVWLLTRGGEILARNLGQGADRPEGCIIRSPGVTSGFPRGWFSRPGTGGRSWKTQRPLELSGYCTQRKIG
jgi:hypothetical protein